MNLKKHLRKTIQAGWVILFVGVLFFSMPVNIYSQDEEGVEQAMKDVYDTKDTLDINILQGELATLKVYSLTRLSISNPGVADVVTADADEMLIIGKTIGETVFFIWDEYGKRTVIIRVYSQDLVRVKQRLERLFEKADVTGINLEIDPYEGKVVLTGAVEERSQTDYETIIGPFEEQTYDLTESRIMADLIQIDMQVAELNTTLQKSLGIDWTTGSNSSLLFTFPETLPSSTDNGFERLLKIGQFSRTSALLATVNAMLSEGKGRVLSKPKLVVVSGGEASFQVGGQVPVRTTVSSAGGTSTENVSFRDYGIIMSLTPTINSNGKISISLNVEISEIDTANSTAQDVAFTTRTAQTSLLLDDKQTIVIAGLIKQTTGTTFKKVPFLGDIPVIGAAFRSKSNPAAEVETEVVISLTPTILKQEYERIESSSFEEGQEELKSEFKDDLIDMIQTKKLKKDKDMAFGPRGDLEVGEVSGEDYDDEDLDEWMEVEDDGEDGDKESEMEKESMDETAADDGESLDAQAAQDDLAKAEGLEKAADDELMIKEADWDDVDVEAALSLPNMDVSDIMAGYVQSVQEKISEAISYPYEAVEKGWAGTVKLTLKILKDGTLDELDVKESSGHNVFDNDALNTAEILAPYDSFPPELDLEEIVVTIPIVYSQEQSEASSEAGDEYVCHPPGHYDVARSKGSLPFIPSGKTYEQLVQERIANSVIYPEPAKEFGWEGTVKLNLRILRDGTLDYAWVKESSGHDIFDACALQTAELVAPYSIFPTESKLQELNVTIPIIYSLERN